MNTIDDRIGGAMRQIAEDVHVADDLDDVLAAIISAHSISEPLRERTTRWVAAAAAAVVAIGIAGIWTAARRDDNRVASTDDGRRTTVTAPFADAVTKNVDGFGTIVITRNSVGQLCQQVALQIGSSADGCYDQETFESGQAYSLVGAHGSNVLFGLTPVDIGLRVELSDRTLTPDTDGLWWTNVTSADTAFTIRTDTESYEIPLGIGSTTTTSAMPAEAVGDPAVWIIDTNAPPDPTSTTFTALVERLGCNGGITGTVLPPTVSLNDQGITITFTVDPSPGGDCPANDRVPYTVELPDAIGDRALIDGECATGRDFADTPRCANNGIRWPS